MTMQCPNCNGMGEVSIAVPCSACGIARRRSKARALAKAMGFYVGKGVNHGQYFNGGTWYVLEDLYRRVENILHA